MSPEEKEALKTASMTDEERAGWAAVPAEEWAKEQWEDGTLLMTKEYDIRIVSDGRGAMLGYVFQKRGRRAWAAALDGCCQNCTPERALGWFPNLTTAVAAIAVTLTMGSRQ
jgi:hypothetical protein